MAALHVRPCVLENLANISGGVPDWNRTARVLLDVVLEVALDGLWFC